jgi:multisubunit Na+/H+ antiporter MnhG subunit
LLFIVTKEPNSMPWLSLIGVFFVASALIAVVRMSDESLHTATTSKTIELVLFTVALFLLALWFYTIAAQVPPYEYLIWFIGAYAVVGGLVFALVDRRRRKREAPHGVV